MSKAKITRLNSSEVLHFGPTVIRMLEDGSSTDNRLSSISSMMPAHVDGPPAHVHLMHDEAFLITSGVLHFDIGDTHLDVAAGDYVVAPVGVPHAFNNTSDEPVCFFTTFTSAFYIESFRESAKLVADGLWNAQTEAEVLMRYATLLCKQ